MFAINKKQKITEHNKICVMDRIKLIMMHLRQDPRRPEFLEINILKQVNYSKLKNMDAVLTKELQRMQDLIRFIGD